ncbi:hypothetical protein Mapa_012111 [Marchantia paleacea]|nr:hypothetical protein Mapa_012111 [Marchantia paleacea]
MALVDAGSHRAPQSDGEPREHIDGRSLRRGVDDIENEERILAYAVEVQHDNYDQKVNPLVRLLGGVLAVSLPQLLNVHGAPPVQHVSVTASFRVDVDTHHSETGGDNLIQNFNQSFLRDNLRRDERIQQSEGHHDQKCQRYAYRPGPDFLAYGPENI